ncbi:hypothetical protein QFZ55_000769 [Streptomyces luteogriseus]|nr:hypothetical protein [Streptomyces luteogriseus]
MSTFSSNPPDAAEPLGVLEQAGQSRRLVLDAPDEEDGHAVAADADVRDRREGDLVDEGGEVHPAGPEGLPGGVDPLDALEQLAVPGGHRVGLQEQRAVHDRSRPARRVEEPAVHVLDAEVHQVPVAVEVRHQDEGGVVKPVGQVHQLGGVRQDTGLLGRSLGRRMGLQRVGAQFGQRLHLADDLRGLGRERLRPGDLQHAVDAAAGAGGQGGPAAVRMVVQADGGQPGRGESGDPLPLALDEAPPRHGHHVRRDVTPARGLGR